ncbi:hypothetical protein BC834DRAFT_517997 [Gloeopeniophorella convolvens]|nr:hypothetical protein BC834DRAFT_517997 [Gloeopeniophorella convolvens]
MPRLLGSVNKTNTLPADTIRIQVLHEGHFHIDAGPGDSAWMVERTMLSSHADALGFGATVCSALAAALAETTTLCLRLDPRGTAPRSLDVQAWWGLLQHFRNVRVLCVARAPRRSSASYCSRASPVEKWYLRYNNQGDPRKRRQPGPQHVVSKAHGPVQRIPGDHREGCGQRRRREGGFLLVAVIVNMRSI